jgi:hypothetical protein
MMIDWQADAAIATIVSSVAIVAGAIFVVIQLRQGHAIVISRSPRTCSRFGTAPNFRTTNYFCCTS